MNAISPTRAEDFPNWYQEVVKLVGKHGKVKGTQFILPHGYRMWELMQQKLDLEIKARGHENFYAPLFVGMDALQEEVNHIEGFAKECAVVTHSRLTVKDGELIPDGELTDPVVVRPTSEAIIGPFVKDMVMSYRDLPLLLNQWANVVRWEMRTRLFLRSSEFLWQEGHTFHASEAEALSHAKEMHSCYETFVSDVLAIPCIAGEKSELERFAGAEVTYTLEMLMQDGKALQGCTSHYLGQNFSKAYDISFSTENGKVEHAFGTSWGITTRMIGAIVMVHGDDDGLCLPPRIAPQHVVIMAFNPKKDPNVDAACEEVRDKISTLQCFEDPMRVMIDKREIRGGGRAWDWVKKGIPIRIEIGPRDIENGVVTLSRRDLSYRDKMSLSVQDLDQIPQILKEIQDGMYQKAKERLDASIVSLDSQEALIAHFDGGATGFVKVAYAGSVEHEQMLAEHQVSIRCLLDAPRSKCVFTGKDTTKVALIAKAY